MTLKGTVETYMHAHFLSHPISLSLSFLHLFKKKILFVFVRMNVLLTYISMYHMYAALRESRRGHWIPWTWSY